MARSKDEETDEAAFKRAFGDVEPLPARSKKRVPRSPPDSIALGPARSRGGSIGPIEPLRVEREANGLVTGRRAAVHASILAALEDPKLELENELDLHGLTRRESEREVLRFLRDAQERGERWVGIVVGKGLHSPGGRGSLRDHVATLLSAGAPARFVLAFRTAPRHLGGGGALVLRRVDRL